MITVDGSAPLLFHTRNKPAATFPERIDIPFKVLSRKLKVHLNLYCVIVGFAFLGWLGLRFRTRKAERVSG